MEQCPESFLSLQGPEERNAVGLHAKSSFLALGWKKRTRNFEFGGFNSDDLVLGVSGTLLRKYVLNYIRE